jgi:hypothetical protein
MHIFDRDLPYGAALKQIADHKLFKSINAEWHGEQKSRCAFRVNTDIGVYIRLATKPVNGEYVFNFKKAQTQEIEEMKVSCKGNVFIVLICYEAREVCVLRVKHLEALIAARTETAGDAPSSGQHNVLITVWGSKSMRARVTVPGRKHKRIKLTRTIPRNAFPKLIFE